MWKLQPIFCLFSFLLLFLLSGFVSAQGSDGNNGSIWQTLGGDRPLVIARGGFSGLFPDSSFSAYSLVNQTSLDNVHVWCDVQLTRDGVGICFPAIMMNNASNIAGVYQNRSNTYTVNGVSMLGWFSLDFTFDELASVNLFQRIFSRTPDLDYNRRPILTVDDVVSIAGPPVGLWLNVPYAAFFSQHNLSMRSYIISVSRNVTVNYISSPEVDFLRSIQARFRRTRLVLQFLGLNDLEPTTNQTYESLLSNLTFISTFASGILVPKSYILPVDESQYLQTATSLVQDAHRAGLQVFASDFANDAPNMPYDYNYDPVAEYLFFVDNGNFSVDGVLSGFPITPSETIDCFSHIGRNRQCKCVFDSANLTVISNEGASGVYPGCTDIAYAQAVSDGAEVIDCPVQITNDGIPFCLGSINLMDRTTVAQSSLSNIVTNNPDLNIENGIFTYNLTWNQIQSSANPQIMNSYVRYSLFRNPRNQRSGHYMQLSEFLALANNASSVSGVLISVENAAYLAANQGLDVIDAVLNALNTSVHIDQMRIMIKFTDSAVLSRFRSRGNNYELVYEVNEDVSEILNSTISDIQNFASSVILSKASVFPRDSISFLIGQTNIVPTLQAFGLQVYVQLFQNEFVSQAYDFYSDATVELNTYFSIMRINGVITDYPATAARYKRNRCLRYTNAPVYMTGVQPGRLIALMPPGAMPPAEAPSPVLIDADVAQSPIPPVAARHPNGTPPPAGPTTRNTQPILVARTILNMIPLFIAILTLF